MSKKTKRQEESTQLFKKPIIQQSENSTGFVIQFLDKSRFFETPQIIINFFVFFGFVTKVLVIKNSTSVYVEFFDMKGYVGMIRDFKKSIANKLTNIKIELVKDSKTIDEVAMKFPRTLFEIHQNRNFTRFAQQEQVTESSISRVLLVKTIGNHGLDKNRTNQVIFELVCKISRPKEFKLIRIDQHNSYLWKLEFDSKMWSLLTYVKLAESRFYNLDFFGHFSKEKN